MVMCLYDHTMHKTTFFIIILIEFTKLLSHKVINRKNCDVILRTRSRFILHATMAESDSTSDSSITYDESDAFTIALHLSHLNGAMMNAYWAHHLEWK